MINYLEELEIVLRNLQIKDEVIQEVILYARLKGRAEAKILKSMYERLGVNEKVLGHGGSSIHPRILGQQIKSSEEEE